MDENNSKKIWTYIQEAGDKLVGNEIANREAKKIVSEEFFNKHFELLK